MFSPRRVSWTVAAILFAAYSALSVERHRRMESTGYDLGIFEQAVRGYAHFRAPVSDYKGPGFNLLGDHFHPILAAIAPLYRLAPSPVTLLVVQAALLALSAVPVTRLGTEWYGARAGACIGFGYGLAWGIQQAVVFDFHEVAFAVPLAARCAVLLALRRERAAAAWSLPLLLVKEDQALIVAAIGVLVFCRGERKAGALLALISVAAASLTTLVIIPAFNPSHSYAYFGVAEPGPDNPLLRLIEPVTTKGLTMLALLAPTLFLCLRSPLALIAVPALAARFWAANPLLWEPRFHYSAVLVPVLFVAALDGLRLLRAGGLPQRLTGAVQAAVPVLVLAAGLVPTVIGSQPLGRLAHASYGHVPPRVAAARRVLAIIPDGAAVAASNRLAPQLTSRCRVFRIVPGMPALRPEWAVAAPPGPAPTPLDGEGATIRRLAQWGYRPVANGGGIVLYRLQSPAGTA